MGIIKRYFLRKYKERIREYLNILKEKMLNDEIKRCNKCKYLFGKETVDFASITGYSKIQECCKINQQQIYDNKQAKNCKYYEKTLNSYANYISSNTYKNEFNRYFMEEVFKIKND